MRQRLSRHLGAHNKPQLLLSSISHRPAAPANHAICVPRANGEPPYGKYHSKNTAQVKRSQAMLRSGSIMWPIKPPSLHLKQLRNAGEIGAKLLKRKLAAIKASAWRSMASVYRNHHLK